MEESANKGRISSRNCAARLLMLLSMSCHHDIKGQPCRLAAFLPCCFSFPLHRCAFSTPLTGSSSEIPQPQSSMVSGFTALPHTRESRVPCASPSLPPLPLGRPAFIALWGQCSYSPAFHSSLREQEVRATGAFEREN